MYTGQVEYTAPVPGIILKPFEINHPHPSVSRVHIESASDSQIRISFFVSDVQSVNEASNLTQDIVSDILDKLSFLLGAPVGPSHLCGASVRKEIETSDGSKLIDLQCTDSLAFDCRINIVNKLDQQSTKVIQDALEQKQMPGIRYFNRYRIALLNTDPVARFMELYKVFLSIFGDSQKQVDQFIQSAEPNVPVSPRPDKPHIKETVYTRLRNEIGHLRPNAVPSTREEIKHWVSRLAGLAKKAIEQNP